MKTIRLIITMIIASLVFSVWTPATVSAKAGDDQTTLSTSLNGGFEAAKFAYVKVVNRTGGILYVELKADTYGRGKNAETGRSYYFGFSNQGDIQFQVLPGRYTYTVRSSNCGGKKINTKFFTGQTNIGAYSCDKKKK